MDHIKEFKRRRDARMKQRLDDEWKTIRGTHVLIDDEGQVSGGPESLKSLIKNSGGFKPGTKKPTKSEVGYKSVGDFKKRLGDRDAAMSEYVQAEEDWKTAKAYRASMAGKTEESLKKDIEAAKKAGDADKLDKAQHDLERYKSGIEKYGKDFGVAAAEKRMNDAKAKHESIDREIKGFEKAKGFGKKEPTPKSFGAEEEGTSEKLAVGERRKQQQRDFFKALDDDRYVDFWEAADAVEAHLSLMPNGIKINCGDVTFKKKGKGEWSAELNPAGKDPASLFLRMRDLASKEYDDMAIADYVLGHHDDGGQVKLRWPPAGKAGLKTETSKVPSDDASPSKKASDILKDAKRSIGKNKKNSEGRWGKDPTSGMTSNITHDVYGDWGKNIKAAPTGTSFSVRSSNRWHDEVEKFTKTDTGWRFERTVDGRGADKGNADLGRIWNSLHDGRLLG